MSPLLLPLLFALGGFGWTLTEYLLHRFSGHGRRGRGRFREEHLRHHAVEGYFAPTPLKVKLAIPWVVGVLFASTLLFGLLGGPAFTLGFVGAYVGYEVLHRRIHTHPPTGPYSRFVRRHHLYHHFHSAKRNHGVTSGFWDRVFLTRDAPGRIVVPPKHAPVWLCGEDGEVKPEFAGDYEMKRRRAAA